MAMKKPPAGKKGKGLRKLDKSVRNKMGYAKKGAKVMKPRKAKKGLKMVKKKY